MIYVMNLTFYLMTLITVILFCVLAENTKVLGTLFLGVKANFVLSETVNYGYVILSSLACLFRYFDVFFNFNHFNTTIWLSWLIWSRIFLIMIDICVSLPLINTIKIMKIWRSVFYLNENKTSMRGAEMKKIKKWKKADPFKNGKVFGFQNKMVGTSGLNAEWRTITWYLRDQDKVWTLNRHFLFFRLLTSSNFGGNRIIIIRRNTLRSFRFGKGNPLNNRHRKKIQ